MDYFSIPVAGQRRPSRRSSPQNAQFELERANDALSQLSLSGAGAGAPPQLRAPPPLSSSNGSSSASSSAFDSLFSSPPYSSTVASSAGGDAQDDEEGPDKRNMAVNAAAQQAAALKASLFHVQQQNAARCCYRLSRTSSAATLTPASSSSTSLVLMEPSTPVPATSDEGVAARRGLSIGQIKMPRPYAMHGSPNDSAQPSPQELEGVARLTGLPRKKKTATAAASRSRESSSSDEFATIAPSRQRKIPALPSFVDEALTPELDGIRLQRPRRGFAF